MFMFPRVAVLAVAVCGGALAAASVNTTTSMTTTATTTSQPFVGNTTAPPGIPSQLDTWYPSTVTIEPQDILQATATFGFTVLSLDPPNTTAAASRQFQAAAASTTQAAVYLGALEFTLTWTADVGVNQYLAVGIADHGMTGKLMVCSPGTVALDGGACKVYDGYDFNLPPAPFVDSSTSSDIVVVSTLHNTTTCCMTVRLYASLLNASTLTSSTRRIIFASGLMNSVNQPVRHTITSGGTVDFAGGVFEKNPEILATVATVAGALWLPFVFALFAAIMMFFGPTSLTPKLRSMMVIGASVLLFLGGLGLGIGIGLGEKLDGEPAPAAFSFGHLSGWIMGIVTYTALRFFNVWTMLLKWHIAASILLWLMVTAHLVAMCAFWSKNPLAEIFNVSGPIPCGFAAYVLLTVHLLIAFIARPRLNSYTWFRLIHFILWIIILVLSCVHELPVLYYVGPPFLLIVIEKIVLMIKTERGGADHGKITDASYFAGGGVTMLTFSTPVSSTASQSGDVLFAVDIDGCRAAVKPIHPFSVAWADPGKMTLMIKNRGPFTSALAQRAQLGNLVGTKVHYIPISSHARSWKAQRLFKGHVVLIGGGVGITAVLSALHWLTTVINIDVDPKQLCDVTFVWSTRDDAWARAILPFLEEASRILSAVGVRFVAKISVTAKGRPPLQVPSFVQLSSGRVVMTQVLYALLDDPMNVTGADGHHICEIVCGPDSFMASVRDSVAAVARDPKFHGVITVDLIEESFDMGTLWTVGAPKEGGDASPTSSSKSQVSSGGSSSRASIQPMDGLSEPMVVAKAGPGSKSATRPEVGADLL